MAKSSPPASVTPVMRQFLSAKEEHPDALLFFRMGDFYELFYDDAVVASRALDLTLTSRNKGAEDAIPMAGVPHHAASSYVKRLTDQGFKVAICEQMADPSKVKGIVPRAVVRVVSPGIAFDDEGLVARENLFLVAVEAEGADRFGIAALDVSTGELSACEATGREAIVAELVRLDPREVLAGPGAAEATHAAFHARPRTVVRSESEAALDDAGALGILADVLGAREADRAPGSAVVKRAAARVLAMAKAAEPLAKLPVQRLEVYELGDTLLLDDTSQRHLELVRSLQGDERGTLLGVVDATMTAPGARLLRRRLLAPLTDVAAIRRRHDAVEAFVANPKVRAEVRSALDAVGDVERLAVKIAMDRAAPRDLVALRRSLAVVPSVRDLLASLPDFAARSALGVDDAASFDACADVHDRTVVALSDEPPVKLADGGVLRDGFDALLDEARTLSSDGQRLLVELEGRLREEAQIPGLKIRYTRVFGHYLEVTRSQLDKVPKTWRRKQTVATGERYTEPSLDTLADKIAHADESVASREGELFASLVKELALHAPRLRALAARLAEWDVASALAEIAHKYDYARPEVDDGTDLVVEEGRHPVVERLAASGTFVPNDVTLSATAEPPGTGRLWLVTGPNMAGKSTFMRQVALVVILAQSGSFVPAKRARVGVVDRVLTRVGASDNLAGGESTFMVEMKETANVLRRATRRSLVVLDEIGRGTSTYDGLAIATAVAEHLVDVVGCRSLFATHYHEMTDLETTHPGLVNVSVSAREHAGDIVFLHQIKRGAASQSYGVACARLAGIPELVLSRARSLLEELERKDAAAPTEDAPRGRRHAKEPQLDLFPAVTPPHPVLERLRAVDVDRLTPLEALTLVAHLKSSLDG
ncbi:MAG: DNA mismatch repair protein MutS [Polyangiaceae bacterium]